MKSSGNFVSKLAIVAATAASAWSGSAIAQTASESVQTEIEAESVNPQGIAEIVVTAQRREENLQDTPIAVTAFGSEELQSRNVENIANVADFTPGLIFDETAPLSGSSSAAVVYIRGIGQSSYQVTDEPGVGTYVDGVYVGSSIGGVLDSADIERVEVLRGPQGTLFGKNTIGGAINITTKRPSAEKSGYGEIVIGNYDRVNARGSINLPLSDNIFSKLSVSHKKADGWVELLAEGNAPNTENYRNQRTPGDDNETSARLAFLVNASDRFSIYLVGDLTHVDEASAPSSLLGVGKNLNDPTFAGDPGVAPPQFSINHGILPLLYHLGVGGGFASNIPGYGVGVPYDDRWVPANPARQSYRTGVNGTLVDTYGLAATLEYELSDDVAIKSISSFRSVKAQLNRDADGSPLTIVHCFTDFKHEQYSQELQLSGNTDKLNWLVGAYGYVDSATDNFRCQLPFNLLLRSEVDNSSLAAFAQATYEIADRLKLTLGARYTRDKKDLFPQFGSVTAFDRLDTLVPNLPVIEVRDTFQKFTPKVSLDYKVSDDLLIYASYTTGYKGGGFSARTLVPRNEVLRFQPETLSTIEGGFKLDAFDRRLRANAAVYFSKYKSIQGTVIEGIAPGTQNIGSADVWGVEAEITALPIDNLLINSSIAYNHNEYTKLNPLSPGVAPDGFVGINNKLTNTPAWTFINSVNYTVPADSLKGKFVFQANYTHYSEIFNDQLNSQFLRQPAYGLLGGQISFVNEADNWTISLWGKNLTDEEYIVSGDDNVYAGFREANYGTPRTYGVSLRYEF